MTVATLTIGDYVAGDTLVLDIAVTDGHGDAVDLTGSSVRWGVASKTLTADGVYGDSIITKEIDDGIVLTDAEAGALRITLGRGEFLGVGSFAHELEVTLATGESYTVLHGVLCSAPAIFPEFIPHSLDFSDPSNSMYVPLI